MSVVAFTSLHGSPGATSLAVAVAHHWLDVAGREVVLIEADPDGGVIAARHQLGLVPGLTELAGSARLGIASRDVVAKAQSFSSGVAVVPAHPSSDRTQAALRAAAGHLSHAFGELAAHDVLVDVGRVRAGSPALPLVEAADRIVVVVRPSAEDLVVAMNRLDLLRGIAPLQVVVVGERPYSATEVANALGVGEVVVAPHDATAVQQDPAALGLRRKPWTSAVRLLTRRLVDSVVDGRRREVAA